MKSYYFDYNSTAPLSSSVKHRLANGAVDFLNPSSLHADGRQALKTYREVSQFLLEKFNLSKTHQIFYHSGATEGVNTIFLSHVAHSDKPVLIIFETDHASVKNCASSLSNKCEVVMLKPLKSGDLDLKQLAQTLSDYQGSDILVNWTWSHNETGVVWPLEMIEQLKLDHEFLVHIDAAQVVSKVANWNQLEAYCDYVTFSGHKFGSLKGIGFTFFLSDLKVKALIEGGGQQSNLRSGTVNVLGIVSLKDALEDIFQFNLKYTEIESRLQHIIDKVNKVIEGRGEIACYDSKIKNNNTFFLVLNDLPSDRSFPLFDIAGLNIGRGSACSSGAKKASDTLLALGYEDRASHGLRFSFSPKELLEHSDIYAQKICEVLERIFSF